MLCVLHFARTGSRKYSTDGGAVLGVVSNSPNRTHHYNRRNTELGLVCNLFGPSGMISLQTTLLRHYTFNFALHYT